MCSLRPVRPLWVTGGNWYWLQARRRDRTSINLNLVEEEKESGTCNRPGTPIACAGVQNIIERSRDSSSW